MRKFFFKIKIEIVGTLLFLGFFVYHYATSGKFRQSIISACAVVGVFLASLQPAYSAGEGVDPMDIGRSSTDLGNNLTYVRGRHGRYIVKNDNGVKDIIEIAYRGARNDMKTLAKEMNKLYNLNIKPGGY